MEFKLKEMLGIVGVVLMSPLSWPGKNLCLLSLAFIIDWRFVSFDEAVALKLIIKLKQNAAQKFQEETYLIFQSRNMLC